MGFQQSLQAPSAEQFSNAVKQALPQSPPPQAPSITSLIQALAGFIPNETASNVIQRGLNQQANNPNKKY